MNCLQFQERLQALLDNRQDIADDQAIRQHMAACPDCEALATAYTAVTRVPLRIVAGQPLAGLADRVTAELNQPVAHTAPAARSRYVRWAQWAVAVAACLLLAVGLIRQNDQASPALSQPGADQVAGEMPTTPIGMPAASMPGSEMFYRTGQGLASFSLGGMQSQGSQTAEAEASSDSQLFRRALDTLRILWPGEGDGSPSTQGETGYLPPPTYAMVS